MSNGYKGYGDPMAAGLLQALGIYTGAKEKEAELKGKEQERSFEVLAKQIDFYYDQELEKLKQEGRISLEELKKAKENLPGNWISKYIAEGERGIQGLLAEAKTRGITIPPEAIRMMRGTQPLKPPTPKTQVDPYQRMGLNLVEKGLMYGDEANYRLGLSMLPKDRAEYIDSHREEILRALQAQQSQTPQTQPTGESFWDRLFKGIGNPKDWLRE